jgi:hypothetical protein
MNSPIARSVVRFFIPAWSDPTQRPGQADVRWQAITEGVGDQATWEQIRSHVSSRGLCLTNESPDSSDALHQLLSPLAGALAERYGGCSLSIQQEPVSIEITPDQLWAYRINRYVAAKPSSRDQLWKDEKAVPSGEPREDWEGETARRIHNGLCRELAAWGIDLAADDALGDEPLLTVLQAGRPMPMPGLRGGLHVLARLGMVVAGHARVDGLLAAGKLARLGFGWLERIPVPREIGAASARRLARRVPDTMGDVL